MTQTTNTRVPFCITHNAQTKRTFIQHPASIHITSHIGLSVYCVIGNVQRYIGRADAIRTEFEVNFYENQNNTEKYVSYSIDLSRKKEGNVVFKF